MKHLSNFNLIMVAVCALVAIGVIVERFGGLYLKHILISAGSLLLAYLFFGLYVACQEHIKRNSK